MMMMLCPGMVLLLSKFFFVEFFFFNLTIRENWDSSSETGASQWYLTIIFSLYY